MIIAEVKGIYTTEMDRLEDHLPDDPENFSIVVRAMVGPRGEKGEESFDIDICTPKWLQQYIERERFLFARHRLFVNTFDVLEITRIVTRFIERCSGASWDEVAVKVSRLGHWEFEDCPSERGS